MAKEEITLEFIHTGGPFGDCTDNYDIITNAKTVGEFLITVLGRDNYQTFCLRADEQSYDKEVSLAYATRGKVTRKASMYNSLLAMRLKNIKANGGWGSMGYTIYVDGELPPQDKRENQIVYDSSAGKPTILMVG